MRKIFIKLSSREDVRLLARNISLGRWNWTNRQGVSVILEKPRLRRSLVQGPFLASQNGRNELSKYYSGWYFDEVRPRDWGRGRPL